MKTETDKLLLAIRSGASALKPFIPWADTVNLLAALAEMESSFGVFNRPKYEAAFAPNGRYFTEDQKHRHIEWGAWAACSYSSFQILYPTACELGFDTSPWSRSPGDLFSDEVAILFVTEYIKRRIIQRDQVTNVRQLGIVYNGGSLKTGNPNAIEYGARLETAYETIAKRRGLTLSGV